MLLRSIDANEQLVPKVLARLRETADAWADELRANVVVLPGVVDVLARLEAAGGVRRSSPGISRSLRY